MESHDSSELIDVRELAKRLNVAVSWVYERTRSGAIPCVRLGKYVRFNPAEVMAFFRTRGKGGNATKDTVS